MKVRMASPSTTGTKTALTRSTSFSMGALLAWAFSTKAMIRASTPSCTAELALIRSSPSPLRAPPITRAPGFLPTGRLSPVSRDSSASLSPSSTSPSPGKRSPGFTITISPMRSASAGISTACPPRSMRAVSGRSFIKARMEAAALRRARASSTRPSSTSVTTTAAASK